MQSIENKIILSINNQGERWAFSKDDFFDLGTDESIIKALYRLNKAGTLRYIFDGIYDMPKFSKLLNQQLSPDMEEVVLAIARKNKWVISPTGNFALNILGLSTQVPGRMIYLSSGSSCSYEYKNQTIQFIQAPLIEIDFKLYESKLLVQAINALGKEHRIDNDQIKLLSQKFSSAQKKQILEDTERTYKWIHEIIVEVCSYK